MEYFLKLCKYTLFIPLAVIFIPSFLVVTFLSETWSSMIGELFGL
ncbi:MAG: hypothetical protein WC795_03295 [Candidatus Paceibacterota bacterium]